MRVLRRIAVAAVGCALIAPGAARTSADAPPVVAGLDHVPIAVNDLDAAAARFREMGFVLKPGVAHDNGIRNQHAKFPDGTELELITAPEGRDGLTTYYRRMLAAGDGPAFVAFYAPDADAAERALGADRFTFTRDHAFLEFADGDPLRYVFLAGRNHSPTDRPEHFAHLNGATSLVEVWIAGADLSAECRLLTTLGATFHESDVRVPEPVRATVAHFAEGDVVLLPAARQILPGRRVIGAVVRVPDVAPIVRIVAAHAWAIPPRLDRAGRSSVFLPPAIAGGLWIEFRAGQ